MAYNPRAQNLPNPRRTNREKFIDVHEILNEEMARQGGVLSQDAGDDFRQPMIRQQPARRPKNIPVGHPTNTFIHEEKQVPRSEVGLKGVGCISVRDCYLYFDSEFYDEIDREKGHIVFDIAEINGGKPLHNIVEMELCKLFVPEVEKEAWEASFWFFRRATISIEKLLGGETSAVGKGNFRYHFLCEADPGGIAREIIPLKNRYFFKYPVNELSEARFIFKAPKKVISIPQEVFTVTAVSATPGRFTTSIPHGLSTTTTHTVYFTGFNSGDPVQDAIVNDPDGHLVDIPDAVTVQLSASGASAFPGPFAGLTATMAIGARKIAFQMRFREITEKDTNYLLATTE